MNHPHAHPTDCAAAHDTPCPADGPASLVPLTRREFIKNKAAAAAALSAGIALPESLALAQTAAQPGAGDGVRWDKGVCRYCGTGCGVLVGVKDGRVVATQGDPDAPVNKGLNCVKGYFLAKIQYTARTA